MSQVAQRAGVSRATVSSILNDRSDCFASPATRTRVMRAVKALGYRPNLAARAVNGAGSATIGLINTGPSLEVTTRGCTAFEAAARAAGYLTIFCFDSNDCELEDQVILRMRDRCVDGIMIVPTEPGDHAELRRLVEADFPVVSLDASARLNFETDDVSVDHFEGGRIQARHLLDIGRRRVALANSSNGRFAVVEQRIAGLEAGLAEAGCPPPIRMDLPMAVSSTAAWGHAEYKLIADFLREHRGQIDAVAAVGDTLGMNVMAIALRLGIKVPQELAVIGYDGNLASENPLLSLTTVSTPQEQCGAKAFELLDQRMKQRAPREGHARVRCAPELVVRGSTVASAAMDL